MYNMQPLIYTILKRDFVEKEHFKSWLGHLAENKGFLVRNY